MANVHQLVIDEATDRKPMPIEVGPGETAAMVARRLHLGANRPVFLVVGSAGSAGARELEMFGAFVEDVLRPLADELNAIVVSGGTDAGVMRVLGRGFADSVQSTLVGVAPDLLLNDADGALSDAVAPERNHDILVRTLGRAWSDGTDFMFQLASALAEDSEPTVILSGGGAGTRYEYRLASKRRWPLLALLGTGREADLLQISDPTNTQAAVHARDLDGLRRSLEWRFSDSEALKATWVAAADYDQRASKRKPALGGLRTVVLALGVGLVALSLYTRLHVETGTRAHQWFTAALAMIPAASAAIMAFISRRGRSGDWVTLRGATNTALREIYLYRADRDGAADGDGSTTDRAGRLKKHRAAIDGGLGARSISAGKMITPGAFPPPLDPSFVAPSDDLLGDIDATKYRAWRLEHQLDHLDGAMHRDDTKIRWNLFAVSVAMVLGTGLASFDAWVAWIAVSAAVATAFGAWLEYDNAEQRRRSMAETVAEVRSCVARWQAVPATQRNDPAVTVAFARECEAALAEENHEWERGIRRAQRTFDQRQVA